MSPDKEMNFRSHNPGYNPCQTDEATVMQLMDDNSYYSKPSHLRDEYGYLNELDDITNHQRMAERANQNYQIPLQRSRSDLDTQLKNNLAARTTQSPRKVGNHYQHFNNARGQMNIKKDHLRATQHI